MTRASLFLDQTVHHRIHGETGYGAYPEFLGDVLAVGCDREDRESQLVCNFLVYVAFCHQSDDFLFPWRQHAFTPFLGKGDIRTVLLMTVGCAGRAHGLDDAGRIMIHAYASFEL